MDYPLEQKFEVERLSNKIFVWSRFSPLVYILPLDRPYTLWKRFNKLIYYKDIRRIKMPNKKSKNELSIQRLTEENILEPKSYTLTFIPRPKPVFPKRIIKQGPATVIFWDDDTKTVVKRAEGEPDDEYVAFTAAVAKKVYGSGSKIKSLLRETETVRK